MVIATSRGKGKESNKQIEGAVQLMLNREGEATTCARAPAVLPGSAKAQTNKASVLHCCVLHHLEMGARSWFGQTEVTPDRGSFRALRRALGKPRPAHRHHCAGGEEMNHSASPPQTNLPRIGTANCHICKRSNFHPPSRILFVQDFPCLSERTLRKTNFRHVACSHSDDASLLPSAKLADSMDTMQQHSTKPGPRIRKSDKFSCTLTNSQAVNVSHLSWTPTVVAMFKAVVQSLNSPSFSHQPWKYANLHLYLEYLVPPDGPPTVPPGNFGSWLEKPLEHRVQCMLCTCMASCIVSRSFRDHQPCRAHLQMSV